MAGWAVVDGQLVEEARAHLSAADRGFVLGDSIFTTLVASASGMFRFDAHWARLERGASLLGIPLPPRTAGGLDRTAHRGGEGAVLGPPSDLAGRHPGRGVAVWDGADVPPTVVVRSFPFAPHPPAARRRGVRAIISPIPKNERSPLLQCKTPFNYGDALIARREARRCGADDALFLNTRGELVSATSANLFCVRDGVLWTPPLAAGALAGVTRGFILEAAPQLGLPAGERPLGPADLLGAAEAFLTDTVGVRPLVSVEGRPIGSGEPGPWSGRCMAAYDAALRRVLLTGR